MSGGHSVIFASASAPSRAVLTSRYSDESLRCSSRTLSPEASTTRMRAVMRALLPGRAIGASGSSLEMPSLRRVAGSRIRDDPVTAFLLRAVEREIGALEQRLGSVSG